MTQVTIFVGSPTDVSEERLRLRSVVERLNNAFEKQQIELRIREWMEIAPQLGNPQGIILDAFPVNTWDIFIGIVWKRFGMKTGHVDVQTGQPFESGTQEEFTLALQSWKQFQRPRVMMYRCERSPERLDDIDPRELTRVRNFFKKVELEGFYKGYSSVEDFERLITDHLIKYISERAQQHFPEPVARQVEVNAAATRTIDTVPPLRAFFGRHDEREEVLKALDAEDRGWGIEVWGPSGIGKTALAVAASKAMRERKLFDAYIFASAQQERVSPAESGKITGSSQGLDLLIQDIARTLGHKWILELPTAEDRRNGLLRALRDHRVLLILDNLETLTRIEVKAVESFLRRLPPPSKAIATTRGRAFAAAGLGLGPLSWSDAKQIIESRMEALPHNLQRYLENSDEEWLSLGMAYVGSPLLLLIAVGLLAKGAFDLPAVLTIAAKHRDAEERLAEFLFRELYDSFGSEERQAAWALAQFRLPATAEALSSVVGPTTAPFDGVIESLLNTGLAQAMTDVSRDEPLYLMDSQMRRLLTSCCADREIATAVAARFASYWAEFARSNGGFGSQQYYTYSNLDREWLNIAASAEWLWAAAGASDNAIQDVKTARMVVALANDLGQFLWFSARREERVLFHRRAYEISVRLEDWREAGWHANVVAVEHFGRGSLQDAAYWAEEGRLVSKREPHSRENRYVRAALLRVAGLIASRKKDYARAKRLLMRALAIQRARGEREWIAMAFTDLGDLAFEMAANAKAHGVGDVERYYAEAEKAYDTALRHSDEGDLKARAFAFGNLAEIAIARERWAEARTALVQKLQFSSQLGFGILIADGQYRLAEVLNRQGQAELALPLAREAYAAYQKVKPASAPAAKLLLDSLQRSSSRH